jgi:signal transduction histidine kinase
MYLLAVANGLVIAMVFLYLIETYRGAEDDARSRAANLAALIRLNFDSLTSEIDMALRSLAEEPVTGAESEARRLRLIDTIARESPEYRTLVIADAQGDFVGGRLAADGKAFSIAGRDYFDYLKYHADARMVVAGPVVGRSNGRWSLVFARRLNDRQGGFAGVVLKGYAVDRFAGVLAPLHLDAFSTVGIFKTDRTFVATYPEHPKFKTGTQGIPDGLEAALAADPQRGLVPRLGSGAVDDPARMIAYERTADGRFYVTVSIRLDQVFGDVHRQAVAFLLLIAVMGAASMYFARRTIQADRRLHDYQDHLEAMVAARTQDLTVARDLAEAANRAKTSFLANMSHELRTPMNGIMGLTELVEQHLADPKDKARLDVVLKSARRLLHLINDLLEVSRIEADRLDLDRVSFKMAALLDNLIRVIGPEAAEKGLAFRVDVPPAVTQGSFLGDPARLGQILTHLAGNAVKFTAAGSVLVSATVEQETESDMLVRFAVQDTGIGISADDQRRLFRLFEQVDGSLTRRYGGTGLGLGLCKRLAELMGGNVTVTSELGRGSIFVLKLRLEKVPVGYNPGTGAPNENGSP